MKLQHSLIEKLGNFLDFVPDESLLKDGILHIDDLQINVSQLQLDDTASVALAAFICPVSPISLAEVLRLAMSANYCWRGTKGATFSYDPMSENLFLSLNITQTTLDTASTAQVGALFLNLFHTAQHWRAVLGQLEFHQTPDYLGQSTLALSLGPTARTLQ